jgi:hypothetical protein
MCFEWLDHHIKFSNLQSLQDLLVVNRLLSFLLCDVVGTKWSARSFRWFWRGSEVIHEDSSGLDECCDCFFLYHCIIWEIGFGEPNYHWLRKCMFLDISFRKEREKGANIDGSGFSLWWRRLRGCFCGRRSWVITCWRRHHSRRALMEVVIVDEFVSRQELGDRRRRRVEVSITTEKSHLN